jgi:hypothetical protein
MAANRGSLRQFGRRIGWAVELTLVSAFMLASLVTTVIWVWRKVVET